MTYKKKFKDIILSKLVKPDHKSVGLEIESIIYTKNDKRLPVNSQKELSAVKLLELMNNSIENNGYYSLEPGGQMEWSSRPYVDLNDLNDAIKIHKNNFTKVLSKNNLKEINYGVDPLYGPDKVDLIKQKKYELMDKYMETSGTMGKWMMRCTASIQVNFDFSSYLEMEEMAYVADTLHPVATYLFSNSPFQNGERTGQKNIRNLIWENTDNARCNNLFDHGIVSPFGLMDNYVKYVCGVPGIFQLDRNGNIQDTKQKFGERTENLYKNGCLDDYDLKASLHQIFTNVRIKNLVEVRGADRTPDSYEIAPAAFWAGILTDEKTRKNILKILKDWTVQDRKIFNRCSRVLDRKQMAPQNKSFGEWVDIIGHIAIEGLKNRNRAEVHLFKNFFEQVKQKGPFGIQDQ